MMLGHHPISAAPISASTGAGVVLRRMARQYAHRPQDLPPEVIHGRHIATHNFHTGEFSILAQQRPRRYHQAFFPADLLKPHSSRRRVDVHFTFVPPHAPPHKLHREAFFPLDLLAGSFLRHRVPGSGLTAIPVQRRSRLYHQAWFPRDLLKGGHRRIFPQAHLEIVVELECPDRRHFADELRAFYGKTEASDSLVGEADETFSFLGDVDESDVEAGVADVIGAFLGIAESADVLVGVADESYGNSAVGDEGDVLAGVSDDSQSFDGRSLPTADAVDGRADVADRYSGRVDECR